MKLYSAPMAPNGLRVTMLADKKGIKLDTILLTRDTSKAPDYLALNPSGQVPTLLLDDGTAITESLVICQYLDAISGAPFLFGDDLESRTRIAMWERRTEMQLFVPAVEYGHHTSPIFAGAITQYGEWAHSIVDRPRALLELLATELASRRFVAGDAFSIADITAYHGVRMAMFFGLYPSPAPAITEWLERVEAWTISGCRD